MKPLFYYALAVLFATISCASLVFATSVPSPYGFALATIGAYSMHGYHIFLNKAGDRGD